jgi:hypothetical protein
MFSMDPRTGDATRRPNVRRLIRANAGVVLLLAALTSACSSPRSIPVLSGDGLSSTTTIVESRTEVPWFDSRGLDSTGEASTSGAMSGPTSDPGNARPRVCSAAPEFRAAGDVGQSGSALLVSGSAAPEPGDVPVRDRLAQMGFQVTVIDDDLVTGADATGMDVVLISESASSDVIGSTFTELAVPLLVWERHMFSELKMSQEANRHTDPQDTIVVSDPTLTCGVTGEVSVVTSDAFPMNRAQPPASARVAAVRSLESDEAVWFGYETGDRLTDGSPAPAARVALWFSYDTPLHTNEMGWRLFARAVAFAIERPASTEPPTDPETTLDPGATTVPPPGTSDASTRTQPSATSPAFPPTATTTPPATTVRPITTRPPNTTRATTTTVPTTAPRSTAPPTSTVTTPAPPTSTVTTPAPTTTTATTPAPPTSTVTTPAPPTATTPAPPTTTLPTLDGGGPPWTGGGPPPWARGGHGSRDDHDSG